MAGKVKRLIARHRWGFNLIHGQSIFPSALAAFLVSQHYKIPFVITLRDDLSHLEDMLDQGTSCFRDLVHEMFHHVSAILVHGPAILRAVDRFLPEKRSIPVLLTPMVWTSMGLNASWLPCRKGETSLGTYCQRGQSLPDQGYP